MLGDFLADENSVSAEEEAEKSDLRECVRDELHKLSPREELVLRLRYGFEGGKCLTLDEIGRMLGVTRERVRQIEAKALRKLRSPAHTKHFLDRSA